MTNYVSPKDIQNTKFGYLHRKNTYGQLIYSITLILICTIFLALPFIEIDISAKGTGQITSALEKVDLITPISGKIIKVNLRDNQKVSRNELLLTVDGSIDYNQISLLKKNIHQISLKLADLKILLDFRRDPQLKTRLYQASWRQFLQELDKSNNLLAQKHQNYDRFTTLFNQKVITQVEFEEHKFNYQQAFSDKEILIEDFKKHCETDIDQLQRERLALLDQLATLKLQSRFFYLNAAITGSIQGLKGIYNGSYVFANQKIGEISPDANLLAVCFVKPADIGLIKINQPVNFQLQAFNYQNWGMVKGTVSEISDDIVVMNNLAYFKVKCKLERYHMELQNGYKSQIKKGMTFYASFIIAKRNLFQLIYGKIDDWINPKNQL